jgi:hypothetical protein
MESGGSNVTIAPRLRGKLISEAVVLPAVRFHVFSPYRDGRYRSAQAREGEAERLQLSFRYLDGS